MYTPQYKVGDVIDIEYNKFNHQTRKIEKVFLWKDDYYYEFSFSNRWYESGIGNDKGRCEFIDKFCKYNKKYLEDILKKAISP